MSDNFPNRKHPIAPCTGPIRPGLPLYVILESIAAEMAARLANDSSPAHDGTTKAHARRHPSKRP